MKKIFLSITFLASSLFAWSECRYSSLKDDGEYLLFKDCIKVDKNENIQIKDKHIKNMFFDKDSLSCIYTTNNSEVFYIHKNGQIKQTYYFDNGCEYFNENDIARTTVNKNVAYMNKNLEVVLETPYFYGTRFHKNKAIVCDDSVSKVYDGEHSYYSGGSCTAINLKGEPLTKEKKTFEEILKLLRSDAI